ncbi:MAG: SRPBCC family protein [Clostridia bacterium]|nr:SRPBCC family protein [Clostridia bacterium]
MYIELSIDIDAPPDIVFAFLRDKDLHPQKSGSPVLLLQKTTPGPAGAGTGYREVVRIMPFIKGEILSRVTHFDPPGCLGEDFSSSCMTGHLMYRILADNRGSILIQRQSFKFIWPIRALTPLIRFLLGRRLKARLKMIKCFLEGEGEA